MHLRLCTGRHGRNLRSGSRHRTATHGFDSDLEIDGIGLDHATINLENQRGFGGNNFGRDCATLPTAFPGASPSFVGTFLTEKPVSAHPNRALTRVAAVSRRVSSAMDWSAIDARGLRQRHPRFYGFNLGL
jgi:hypothetical protein